MSFVVAGSSQACRRFPSSLSSPSSASSLQLFLRSPSGGERHRSSSRTSFFAQLQHSRLISTSSGTMAPKSSSSQAQFNANLRNRFNNHSLSSGPSSFPRRAPLPAGAAAAAAAGAGAGGAGSTRSAWTQASTDPKGKGKGKIEEIQEEEPKADNMARRLTRFYTSNFERRPVITLW